MIKSLLGLAIGCLIVWVVVKLIIGIGGALIHLLLLVAVVVVVVSLVQTAGSRRA